MQKSRVFALLCLGLAVGLGTSGCTESKNYYTRQPDGGQPPDLSVGMVCTPGAVACVDNSTFHACHANGQWGSDVACPAGNGCTAGVCAPIPSAAPCVAGTATCMGNMTVTCNANGFGYTVAACPSPTSCVGGQCTGSCGVVGASHCVADPSMIATCDGTLNTTKPCPAAGSDGRPNLCVETANGAACMPANCDPRTGCDVCGNPSISSVSATSNVSTCAATPLGYQWKTTACLSGVCTPAQPGACVGGPGHGASCTTQCRPGAQVCSEGGLATCQANGIWGAPVSCNIAAGETCVSRGGVAVCADPVCANQNATGACVGTTQIRICDATGHIAATATNCASGACFANGGLASNGLQPGNCTAQCSAGETQCDNFGAIQSCVNGLWSTQVTSSCTADGSPNYTCIQLPNPAPNRSAICGLCQPGLHQCTDVTGTTSGTYLETCQADGSWGVPVACTIGDCAPRGGDAACQAQCLPNSPVCLGGRVPSPSPSPSPAPPWPTGTIAVGTCTADGHLPAAPNCPGDPSCCNAGTSCRLDSAQNALGCVVCVGQNSSANADAQCLDGSGNAGLTGVSMQVCAPDSSGWQAAQSCGSAGCFGACGASISLWLRADVGVTFNGANRVTNWADQSGNGRDGVQNGAYTLPLYVAGQLNGNPVLRFNGNQLITSKAMVGGSGPYAIFVVASANRRFGAQGFIGWGNYNVYSQTNAFRLGNSQLINYWWANDIISNNTTVLGPQLFESTYDGKTRTLLRDGVVLKTIAGSDHNIGATPATIGITDVALGEYFRGDIAEVLVLDGPIGSEQRFAIESYLRAKYALY